MSLKPGTRLGAYEVLSPIGSGGMGEVYRARDTRLHRDVAIKVLPEAFAQDADRLARFQREAQVLASLNHPHIAAIYGLETTESGSALILELVNGPTLADRIVQGALPLDEALSIARQIADALEVAHEHGIIHRDLKPANIKLTADGNVKVLDFGLAKAADTLDGDGRAIGPAGSPYALSQSPTLASPGMTMGGVILGTAPYMSPEQAKGKSVDKRTDIWAFGCVLYEMLTGRRAFDGDDVADVLAKVLQRDPDYTLIDRGGVPSSVRKVVRRCLEKERKRRLADIADARFELDEPAAEKTEPAGARRSRWVTAAVVVSVLLAGSAAGFVAATRSSSAPPEQSIRFQLNLPTRMNTVGGVAVSPDGRHLAFTGQSPGAPVSLYLRPVNAIAARALSGTEGAFSPFWSPDSRFVAFVAGGSLKKIEISSGSVTTIATGDFGWFASWGAADTLLFSRARGIHRVSSTGSSASVVVQPEDRGGFDLPSFLPDGEGFLFAQLQTLVPQRGAATVYVGSLGSDERRELMRADSRVVYANGHVLFVSDRTLMAQPFDLASRTLSGDPVRIAENLWPGSLGLQYFSASQTGVLAFPVRDVPPAQLAWLDRSGRQISAVGEPGDYSNPKLSPDGKKLAVCVYDRQTRSRDIWILDLERGTRTKLTNDPADDMNPAWSPDGMSVAFSSDRKGQRDVYRKSLQSGDDQLLYASSVSKSVSDWSPDGRHLIFSGPQGEGSGISIIRADAAESSDPVRWLTSPFSPGSAQYSPDGRWVVFSASETGRNEIYVAPASGPGAKVVVSTGGGIQPRWSRDGKEIFYLTPQRDKLMVAAVKTGAAFDAGPVHELFQLDVADALGSLYDVSPDGQRFLVNVRVGERVAPITVVVNWMADLKK